MTNEHSEQNRHNQTKNRISSEQASRKPTDRNIPKRARGRIRSKSKESNENGKTLENNTQEIHPDDIATRPIKTNRIPTRNPQTTKNEETIENENKKKKEPRGKWEKKTNNKTRRTKRNRPKNNKNSRKTDTATNKEKSKNLKTSNQTKTPQNMITGTQRQWPRKRKNNAIDRWCERPSNYMRHDDKEKRKNINTPQETKQLTENITFYDPDAEQLKNHMGMNPNVDEGRQNSTPEQTHIHMKSIKTHKGHTERNSTMRLQ